MFRTVSPSIIRSLRLYIQHNTIQVLWLLASKKPQNLHVYDIYLMLYVQSWTPDDGRRDLPKHVECFLGFSYRASFKHYDKGYQQMPLSFVIFLYLHVSSLHVSGLYQPIIRGIPSCCLFVTTWFM